MYIDVCLPISIMPGWSYKNTFSHQQTTHSLALTHSRLTLHISPTIQPGLLHPHNPPTKPTRSPKTQVPTLASSLPLPPRPNRAFILPRILPAHPDAVARALAALPEAAALLADQRRVAVRARVGLVGLFAAAEAAVDGMMSEWVGMFEGVGWGGGVREKGGRSLMKTYHIMRAACSRGWSSAPSWQRSQGYTLEQHPNLGKEVLGQGYVCMGFEGEIVSACDDGVAGGWWIRPRSDRAVYPGELVGIECVRMGWKKLTGTIDSFFRSVNTFLDEVVLVRLRFRGFPLAVGGGDD